MDALTIIVILLVATLFAVVVTLVGCLALGLAARWLGPGEVRFVEDSSEDAK